jgi:ribosomal protein S18 acetylase RimI-like enzyme
MNASKPRQAAILRAGTLADLENCLRLWVDACTARDGRAVDGVAARARPKFERAECWIVAEDAASKLVGFVLATVPGSGIPTDPPDAPVIGLLAVAPAAQGHGLGRVLLNSAEQDLTRRGHTQSVLHVLSDNHAAVRSYLRNGWLPYGEPFEHSLLKRPTQTYVRQLRAPGTDRPPAP